MGAPSTFNRFDADTICEALAEGHSLLSICEAMGLNYTTAMAWERHNEEHRANATRAREIGCRAMAEEMLQIADTPQVGEVRVTKPDGTVEIREEDMTQHRRLRIETRKWLLSKWASKVYGEKQQVEHSGQVDVAATLLAARKRSGIA